MRKLKKGFTLIELLVVIAIIAILVVIALVAINPVRVIEEARDSRNRAEMSQIKTALQMYYNDNRSYPLTGVGVAALETTYMRQLPSVTTDTTFSYSSGGADYSSCVAMNHPTPDDNDSATKCSGAAGNFCICPD